MIHTKRIGTYSILLNYCVLTTSHYIASLHTVMLLLRREKQQTKNTVAAVSQVYLIDKQQIKETCALYIVGWRVNI